MRRLLGVADQEPDVVQAAYRERVLADVVRRPRRPVRPVARRCVVDRRVSWPASGGRPGQPSVSLVSNVRRYARRQPYLAVMQFVWSPHGHRRHSTPNADRPARRGAAHRGAGVVATAPGGPGHGPVQAGQAGRAWGGPGFRARRVSPAALGFGVTSVRDSGDPPAAGHDPVAVHLSAIPEVLEAHTITGYERSAVPDRGALQCGSAAGHRRDRLARGDPAGLDGHRPGRTDPIPDVAAGTVGGRGADPRITRQKRLTPLTRAVRTVPA